MSLGSEFTVSQVNLSTQQTQSANATARDGRSVVVWSEDDPDGGKDIHARLYNSGGGLVRDFTVRGGTSNPSDASVAIDDQGEFVVTWAESGDIKARMFRADGTPRTATFTVAAGAQSETDPDVATDAVGNFVVSYTDFAPDSSNIRAVRYDSNGVFQRSIGVAVTANSESQSSVAMAPSGQFYIAYTSDPQGSEQANVRLQRYDGAGNHLGFTVPVAQTGTNERDPDVAMDNQGNAVVVYESAFGGDIHVLARRVDSAGNLGTENRIANFFNVNSTDPVVAMKPDGSGYVVAYDVFRKAQGVQNVRVTEMRIAANGFDQFVKEHNINFVGDLDPAISMDAEGDFLLTYTRSSGSNRNIYGRRGRLFA